MQSDALLGHLAIDGWCVVEGVVPEDEVEGVRRSVLEAVERHRRPDPRAHLGKVSGLINHDQALAPYLVEPRLQGLVQSLLGPQMRVSYTTGMITYPGHRRGSWHADWPFNQHNAGHVPAPYPDAVMHLTSIWMLSEFTRENGATLVVPGSHRSANNPSGGNGVDERAAYPTERQVCGPAGSVLLMDSRLWHSISAHRGTAPRVAVVVRWAPWWLNLESLRPGSEQRQWLRQQTGLEDNDVPELPEGVFAALPAAVKPLFRHWVGTAG